jgi:hypothetical protein
MRMLDSLSRRLRLPAGKRLPSHVERSLFLRTNPSIEPLEARIAPATLISPTTVTFQDKNGDAATVTISKPLFTAANVSKVFTFDTGSVNGDNSATQQLELLNITALGPSARGMNLSITAVPVSSSPGVVNVGYINSSGIDLGIVNVGGDLGRIQVGDLVFSTPAMKSLTVESLGAQGIATQATGGNLNSLISGPVGSITVNGDIDQATIGIGGGPLGVLGALTVTGSINGGATAFSGSIRTQGGINTVQIDGSINGGAASSSGVIGTAGHLGAVIIDGSVIGAGGPFSGAILASGAIGSVQINGDLTGGSGADSGEIGTASTLGSVVIGGTVHGGGGPFSGVILASRAITSISITNGLVGGSGPNSGELGSGASIGTITIGSEGLPSPVLGPSPLDGTFQGIDSGSGAGSGIIVAQGSIGAVTIGGFIDGSFTNEDTIVRPHAAGKDFIGSGNGGGVISAGGGITSVNVTEGVDDGGILSGASIGAVTIGTSLSDGSEIHAHQNIGTVSVNFGNNDDNLIPGGIHPFGLPSQGFGGGILDSAILADNGSIGSISAGGSGFSSADPIGDASIAAGGNIGLIQAVASDGAMFGIFNSDVVAGSLGQVTASSGDGTGIYSSDFVVSRGIGTITGYGFSSGENGVSDGIFNTTIRAGAGIAGITAISYDTVNSGAGAIVSSGFDAGGSIGPINSTGAIAGSVFVAGINLGANFNVSGAGTFGNGSFGFGSSKSAVAATIGDITLNNSASAAQIEQSTFLAGVHGAGIDGVLGTKDDSVPAGSSIGTIVSPDGLDTVFVESGSIGITTSGAIVDTTYLATDSAVSAGGIGAIVVNAVIPGPSTSFVSGVKPLAALGVTAAISDSTFISNAGIAGISVILSGDGTDISTAGISGSTFLAGHAFGMIGVTNNVSGTTGSAYGIANSTFNAGYGGYGGTGDLFATLTQSGPDGSSAAIFDSNFDSSVCACMSANMGSISAENADTGSGAAGIVDSVFRVHGNIGSISSIMDSAIPTASAIQGSTFSAFGSIGQINTYGSILADSTGPSRFLAGYDIGTDMTFGNEDLGAKSLALHAGQSVGDVEVSGNFEGSDIIASINPGPGYVFGASTNTNVGSGGFMSFVTIGFDLQSDGSPFTSDHATSHAIEAATFAVSSTGSNPTVTAFGFTDQIPVVLYVDGSTGDVRITNLTPADT